MTSPPQPRAGIGLALLSALAFSTLGIWGKLATAAGLSSFGALTWRFGITAALLLPFTRGLTPAQRGQMLAVGLLYALATTCYFSALERISAGTTGLLLYLAPAFVVLLAWAFGRRPQRTQLGAVALAGAGLALVIGLPSAADRDALGLLFGAGGGAAYALYLLAAERWLRGLPALACTAHMSLGAAAYFGALASFGGTLSVPDTPAQWGALAGMVVFPTLIATPALYGAVARLGAAQASLICTLEPLFTVLLAFLILDEPLRPTVLLGGGLILGGAVMAQQRSNGQKVEPSNG